MSPTCLPTAASVTNRACDARAGASPGHQREDLAPARGEAAEGVVPAVRELADHLGVHDRRAPGDPHDRGRGLAGRADPVLEQVADAGAAAEAERMGGGGLLDVLAGHEDEDVRVRPGVRLDARRP
jgi:hypothetical protein